MFIPDRPAAVVGADHPRTRQELLTWFPDDSAALAYLARLRWPGGFTCPLCSSTRAWPTARARWMCAACGRQTSATAGTIFHRMRSPLTTWFEAIWLVTSRETGASPGDLQRLFGFRSDQTSWAWLEKLRGAMVPPPARLSGLVEIGEVLVDVVIGRESRPAADAYTDRSTVMIAVESTPDGAQGRVRLALADAARPSNLVGFAMQVVREGSTIAGDRAADVNRLRGLGYHSAAADRRVPGIDLVASALTDWLRRTLHGPVSRLHLDYFLDEFTFRFDCRSPAAPGYLFYRLLQQAVTAVDPAQMSENMRPERRPAF